MAVIFNDKPFELKYLFGCQYENNKFYHQTKADISRTNPEKSAFFDVKDLPIEKFWLEKNGYKLLVDLTDGHFEENEKKIEEEVEEGLTNFRIIYFRRHFHTSNVNTGKEISHHVEYHLGWQANRKDGSNVQKEKVIH
jgi:hypothetical protein